MKNVGMKFASLLVVVGALAALPLWAQEAPQVGGANPGGAATTQGGGGGGRGGRNFDPAAFRQRMQDNLKQQLGTTDDEFKALQPKIEKVQNLQRDALMSRFMGGMGGRGGRGGPGGPGGGFGGGPGMAAPDPATLSPTAKATQELRTVLENKDAKAEDIKAKLTALREAKAKAREDLKTAQKDLTELLTQRQEAVLVEMGILE
ncbi:MAG: hypothetical protein WCI73_20760 [Phycisphaerae bacterium]